MTDPPRARGACPRMWFLVENDADHAVHRADTAACCAPRHSSRDVCLAIIPDTTAGCAPESRRSKVQSDGAGAAPLVQQLAPSCDGPSEEPRAERSGESAVRFPFEICAMTSSVARKSSIAFGVSPRCGESCEAKFLSS